MKSDFKNSNVVCFSNSIFNTEHKFTVQIEDYQQTYHICWTIGNFKIFHLINFKNFDKSLHSVMKIEWEKIPFANFFWRSTQRPTLNTDQNYYHQNFQMSCKKGHKFTKYSWPKSIEILNDFIKSCSSNEWKSSSEKQSCYFTQKLTFRIDNALFLLTHLKIWMMVGKEIETWCWSVLQV